MRKVRQLEIDSLDEISAVDRPAQPGARAVIYKRAPSTATPAGDTLPLSKNTPGVAGGQGNQNMTNQEPDKKLETVTAELAAVTKRLEIADVVASLSDAEKAIYKGLDAAGQETFRKLSPEQRAERVRQTERDNDVVYKSLDGETFRKSDDPRLVALAKRSDEDRKSLALERAERASDSLKKRAGTELAKLPGDELAKVALLRVVDGISDETVRKAVAEILKAGNDAMSRTMAPVGTSAGAALTSDAATASVELEKLAKQLATSEKITIDQAFVKVLETSEGKALYNQSCAIA